MKYNIRSMTYEQALAISKWKYEKPFAIYSMDESEEGIKELLDGSYYSVLDGEGRLMGFYCFGKSAQVPIGTQYGAYDSSDFIDIGLGMRPELCGHGLGHEFLKNGIEFAERQFGMRSFRLTVAAFNKRAIKVYENIGFQKVTSFERKTQDNITVFDVMIK